VRVTGAKKPLPRCDIFPFEFPLQRLSMLPRFAWSDEIRVTIKGDEVRVTGAQNQTHYLLTGC